MMGSGGLSESVNVLILGGLTHVGRALVSHLTKLDPQPNEPLVKHIRFADKYLVSESASTAYVDPETAKALADPRVEYRQANLTNPMIVSQVFDAPDGSGYDFVYDLTGEGILVHDVPTQLLLERTTKLAATLANEAARRNVKAYIRDTPPVWKTRMGVEPLRESDLLGRGEANAPRAFYYYEAERAVANVHGLPLAILRAANVWGPHQYYGTVTPKIALGEIYSYLNEPMRILWSGDVRSNTLHVRDWCSAAWSAARWVSKRSRNEANVRAGIALAYIRPKKELAKLIEASQNGAIEHQHDSICPINAAPVAPVFHLTDGDDVNRARILKVIGQVFNIETGFTNAAINAWAKLNLGSVVDDINEKHAEAMARLTKREGLNNNNTPLTCYLSIEELAYRVMALNSEKAQNVLQWYPQEKFDVSNVKEVVDSFKKTGVWVSH